MPQLAPITVKDGANVDVVYTPEGIVDNIATLLKSTGVPVGDQRLSFSLNRTSGGRRKALIKMAIPVVQDVVVAGVSRPTVVRTAYAETTISMDETSSEAERVDALARIKNVLAHATTIAVVTKLEQLY